MARLLASEYGEDVCFVSVIGDDAFGPMLGVIVLQMLAYFASIARGCDVDKPRNLAKSVTVE